MRAEGNDSGSSTAFAAAASAPRYAVSPCAESRAAAIVAHSASTSAPHSRSSTILPSRSRRNPGSRPRAAARSLLRPTASISWRESGGLSVKRQCSRKMSRNRTVSAVIPMGEKGSRSIARLDVLDPALAQRVQRALARVDDALRPDGAVELVLDLQEAGRELAVVAFAVADADRLVRRVGLGDHVVETGRVALDAVVAHRERVLRFGEVAQASHPEGGGVRQVERAGRELLQRVLAALDEARAYRGRGAEEIGRASCRER